MADIVMENKNLAIVIRLVAGAMLLLALANWPYGYYQLLRIVVCGSSIFLIWYFKSIKRGALGWFFVVPAVLFNPLVPFYLSRQSWQPIDIACGLLFLGSWVADTKTI